MEQLQSVDGEIQACERALTGELVGPNAPTALSTDVHGPTRVEMCALTRAGTPAGQTLAAIGAVHALELYACEADLLGAG